MAGTDGKVVRAGRRSCWNCKCRPVGTFDSSAAWSAFLEPAGLDRQFRGRHGLTRFQTHTKRDIAVASRMSAGNFSDFWRSSFYRGGKIDVQKNSAVRATLPQKLGSNRRPMWKGSTTVVYTAVWRNPVVWWEVGNTALWLVRQRVSLYVPSMAPGSFPANHIAVPPSHQTTEFRQTTV